MISGIEHIGIMAKDPVRLASWYEHILNFRTIFRTKSTPPIVFIAGENGGIIEFIPCKEEADIPVKDKRMHLAIAVENFELAVNQLDAKGVALPDAPLEVFNGGKAIFFQDPEGNWLHLIYRPALPWSL